MHNILVTNEGMCDVVDATVDRIMNKEVATVSPTTLLQEAVRKMNALRIGCLVVESNGQPVGIITERDILRLVENGRSPYDLQVKMIMTSPVEVIGREQNIEDASSLMLKQRIRRLPVVNDGKLVGIITSTDILRAAKEGMLAREVFIYLSDIFKDGKLSPSNNLSPPDSRKVVSARPDST